MNVKPFLVPFLVIVLGGCQASTDNMDVRTAVSERLMEPPSEAASSSAATVILNQGFLTGLKTAVLANEGYMGALALEAEALGQVGVARSVLRPQLTGNARIGGIRETGGTNSTTTGATGGLSLSQLVYDGGASGFAVNRAQAVALSAQSGRLVQANDIALKASRAWIDVWQYSERLRLMRTRSSEMETLLEQIERMASNGMLDKASLESARRQIVDIRLEESRLQAGQSEAQILFMRFFQTQASDVKRPAEILDPAEAKVLADQWQSAPVLQRQAADLMISRASLGEAQAAFKPRARLQAGANSPLDPGETTDLTVGFTLEYAFNDGGRRKKQLEAAMARVQAADAQFVDLQRSTEAEMQAGLTRLASLERTIPLLREKLRLSSSEAAISRSQLLTGQSSLRQLIEAEVEIYRAQDQLISTQAERMTVLLTIAARSGALSTLIGLED